MTAVVAAFAPVSSRCGDRWDWFGATIPLPARAATAACGFRFRRRREAIIGIVRIGFGAGLVTTWAAD